MPSSLIFFSATPTIVGLGKALTLKVNSISDGNVIYSLPDDAPVTFSGGLKTLKKTLIIKKDETITSLQGTPGIVVIKARLEGELDSWEQTVELRN
jgi:hypothetical protein